MSEKLKNDLDRFYNPTVETARNIEAEKQLQKLNGKSPVGEWIKGWYAGLPVNGFVLKIIGYGIVNVYWVQNKIAFEGKGTTVGLHGGTFQFYDNETDLNKYDINTLIDYALYIKDYNWLSELRSRKYGI
jgi:hypothetical protein